MIVSMCIASLWLGGAPAPVPVADKDEGEKARTHEARIRSLEEEVARLGAASVATEEQDDDALDGSWSGGKFHFVSRDGNFTAQFGGRLHMDAGGVDTDDNWDASVGMNQEDAAEIRAGRLFMAGVVNKTVEYKWQIDFAGGVNKFKDFYLALEESPAGKIKFGQFKESQGLEELTSSNYISTMERSSMGALIPGRNIGLQVSDHNAAKTVTWAAGAFKDDGSDTGMQVGSGETNLTARVTGTPWNRNGGRELLHVGASARASQDVGGMMRFKTNGPTAITTSSAVDTGAIAANGATVYGIEGALVQGPFSLQGEWTQAMVDAKAGSNPEFSGWYALASWFLTGENRVYKTSSASFSRVKPKHNYGPGGGGAYEAVARVGAVDLDDAGVTGGELQDLTLGLNWYLLPNSRIMLNWIHMELDGSRNGDADVVALRWQLDF